MKLPSISLLIPVYNGGEYLKRLLECIAGQTFHDYEVICVEDGSTDASLSLLQSYATADPRFRVIQRKTKGGTAVAGIKYGLPYCRGKYFFFLSQDDLIDADTLELLFHKAEESGADAVVPDMEWFWEGKNGNPHVYPPTNRYDSVLDGLTSFKLAMSWKIHGFYLRRTDLLKKVGYDDSFLTGCECCSRKYLFYCKKVVFCRTMFYYRQDNASAITKSFKPSFIEDIYGYLVLLHFMKANGLGKDFIDTWRNYTADLFHLYRKQAERNYGQLSEANRLLTQKKLNTARNRFLWFSVSNGYWRRCREVWRTARIRQGMQAEPAIFEELPFKAPCRAGRYTYSGSNIFVGNPDTEIGSFSSLADNISIGLGEHPLGYLSTSPYFYQERLGWREGSSEVFARPCNIGSDVWIGQNAIIREGVSIGHGAVIGAGAVVLRDVPPYAIVAGVPARILRFRFSEEEIASLLRLQWWDLPEDIIKELPFDDIEACILKLEAIRAQA